MEKNLWHDGEKALSSDFNRVYDDIISKFDKTIGDFINVENTGFLIYGFAGIQTSPATMSVNIDPGVGLINGNRILLNSITNINVFAADTFNRIDLITVKYNSASGSPESREFMDEYGGLYDETVNTRVTDSATLTYYKGDVGGLSPVVPVDELAVCTIDVNIGTTQITQSMIDNSVKNKFNNNIYYSVTAGSSDLIKYNLVYKDGSGYYQKADASDTTKPAEVILIEDIEAYHTGRGMKVGTLVDDSWSFIPLGPVFLSVVAGSLTQAFPTTVGSIIQIIGRGNNTTLDININPDYFIEN